MSENTYQKFFSPRNLEQALLAIAVKNSPPENVDRVDIYLTTELIMDLCVRIKQLEDPIFLAGGTDPENGAITIED